MFRSQRFMFKYILYDNLVIILKSQIVIKSHIPHNYMSKTFVSFIFSTQLLMLMTVQVPHVYMDYAKTSTLNTFANVQTDSGVQIAQVSSNVKVKRSILTDFLKLQST